MYSRLKNVQILIALLKQHGIRKAVVSPGGASIPIVRSMENDPFFQLFSVVDERSAAYFALGIAQIAEEPVAVVCTSGTAVCNYLSGANEAFYQRVPLVFITADRHPYLYQQLETQKINQDDIFKDVTKKKVTLPSIHTDDDYWYCQRLVNEALLALNHHGAGPVHINIPTAPLDAPDFCAEPELPAVRAISRITATSPDSDWQSVVNQLAGAKRILVVFGQALGYSSFELELIKKFCCKFNCALSAEHLSNLHLEEAMVTYRISETCDDRVLDSLLPDIVISLGDNFSAARLKSHFRSRRGQFAHWVIDETGNLKDVFKSLSIVFECSPSMFFCNLVHHAPEGIVNDCNYKKQWEYALCKAQVPELPFSNVFIVQQFAECIPPNSLLHLAILTSTRLMHFFSLKEKIQVFSNIGALGIDGTMSTFLGQAAVSDKLCFLLIGDLSFFYDMNSIGIRHISNNVRILMMNNNGACEFHFGFGKRAFPRIDENIGVRHSATAKAWVESRGFHYVSASSETELACALDGFAKPSDQPIFVEAFTDMEQDADLIKAFYKKIRDSQDGSKKSFMGKAKQLTQQMLGDKATEKIHSMISG